ncbi:MAG: glycosyltransferase family 4 protein, partial [bacterium]|nr:glycosyltransferase family 4 protein [bacterium]
MKKVLVITYYWPPAGGPAVQRVLKFVKYLPQFGWRPIILTIKDGEFQATDYSLIQEIQEDVTIYKTKAIEPHKFYKKIAGIKSDDNIPFGTLMEKNVNWKKKLSNWLRVNIFIPDSRVGWIPFALKEGKRIIRDENIDLIFSSSPPPTVHLIAKKLSRGSGLKWVADFRDPWTGIYKNWNWNRFFISKIVDSKMERSVLASATAISAVSRFDIYHDYTNKVKQTDKFHFIPNGYDEEDFKHKLESASQQENEQFTIIHIGSIDEERMPLNLFRAIKKLDQEKLINETNLCLIFVGKYDKATFNKNIDQTVKKYIKLQGYVPHDQLFEYLQRASILLLLIYKAANNIPGKTFEYLRSGKPLLVIGPESGEVARMVNEVEAGVVIDYQNFELIYQNLKKLIEAFFSNKLKRSVNIGQIQQYERK